VLELQTYAQHAVTVNRQLFDYKNLYTTCALIFITSFPINWKICWTLCDCKKCSKVLSLFYHCQDIKVHCYQYCYQEYVVLFPTFQ